MHGLADLVRHQGDRVRTLGAHHVGHVEQPLPSDGAVVLRPAERPGGAFDHLIDRVDLGDALDRRSGRLRHRRRERRSHGRIGHVTVGLVAERAPSAIEKGGRVRWRATAGGGDGAAMLDGGTEAGGLALELG